MNRMFLIAVISIALVTSSASAQNKKDAQATGTTRVAVINLGVVFNKYERAASFKKEIETAVGPLKEEAKKLTEDLTAWQVSLQKLEPGDSKRKQYEEKIILGRRHMEDMQRTASFRLGKQQETNLLILYKDVHQAVKDYSARHNIELVMAYGDPIEKDLTFAFANVTRKMQAADNGGSVPFFVTPRADISEAVANMLNKQYRDNRAKADLE